MPKHTARYIKGKKGMENRERGGTLEQLCVKVLSGTEPFKTGIAQGSLLLGNWLIIDGF